MQPQFEAMQFTSIGEVIKSSEPHFAWVPLSFYFRKDELGTHPHIEIKIAIIYEDSWTMQQIKQAAFEKAQRLLQHTADLASLGFDEVSRRTEEHRAEELRQRNRLLGGGQ
jgi:hypothetical protein